MTFLRLLARNLLYHWRGNLAVFLGVALGTAVLTGALLVGDSLRGSLRELTLGRLGWVEQAMIPGRLFRAALAEDLPARRKTAALLLSGTASNARSGAALRCAGNVTILGVDAAFWSTDRQDKSQTEDGTAVLNPALASALGVQAGDTITLQVQKATEVPRESLLGKRKTSDVLATVDVEVVLVSEDAEANFSLKSTPEPVRNIFVPLRFLQAPLGLEGQANAVFIAGGAPNLAAALGQHLTLEDWGLRLRTPRDRALALVQYLAPHESEGSLKPARWRGRVPDELAKAATANKGILTREQVVAFYEQQRPYVSLESRQIFLSPTVVAAAEAISAGSARRLVLVYLADGIVQGDAKRSYVVVGAVRMGDGKPWPALGKDAPTPAGPDGRGGIVLVDTPEAPWHFKHGEPVDVDYFVEEGQPNQRAVFTLQGIVPMHGELDDPDLTPEFPGITDQPDMRSWRPTFPYDSKRVTPADEAYWQRYRATPRAYVNLEVAQALWGRRFGSLTAVQFYGADAGTLARELLAKLTPERGGFVFQPVREQAERASTGSTDFGELFLAFSFFLIAAALLLVGLLVRLNLERRASEIGLLLAIGWDHARVRWLLLGEGAALAVVGGGVGLLAALGYAGLMLDLLRANWPGGENLNFLHLHLGPLSFVYGYVGSLLVSILTIFWATRMLGKLSARALLAGDTGARVAGVRRAGSWSRWVLVIAIVGAIGAIVAGYFAEGQEAQAGSFFSSGALLLTACLAGVWQWLLYTGRQSAPRPSLTALGLRNAGRNAVRSLLTVGLLASATFLIVAVESFHKDAHVDYAEGDRRLILVGETTVPLFEDLDLPGSRKELGLARNRLFANVRFYACRVRGSDDTSCLNLYRPLEPRVMGVPQALLQQWPSVFTAADAQTPGLAQVLDGGDGAIPAALDANTAQWILKKNLGDLIDVENERGETIKLRVAALLQESIFQSEVLISDRHFRAAFPRQEGFSFFLVEARGANEKQVADIRAALETALADHGVRVQTPAERLAGYLAVENTYLATFQALGGLGLILGAAGLAIILLRGVWERRGELALLRALGFTPIRLAWLVLAENLALLLLGLAAGTVAALVSVAPHLAGAAAHGLWLRIGELLALVLATGLLAGGLAVVTTLRAPLLAALRRE